MCVSRCLSFCLKKMHKNILFYNTPDNTRYEQANGTTNHFFHSVCSRKFSPCHIILGSSYESVWKDRAPFAYCCLCNRGSVAGMCSTNKDCHTLTVFGTHHKCATTCHDPVLQFYVTYVLLQECLQETLNICCVSQEIWGYVNSYSSFTAQSVTVSKLQTKV